METISFSWDIIFKYKIFHLSGDTHLKQKWLYNHQEMVYRMVHMDFYEFVS